MKINHSNLSAREHLRINGHVPADMLETLLDRSDALNSLGGIAAHLSEAKSCFPSEDFLDPLREELQALHKNLRGPNKETLGRILGSMGYLAQLVFNESDYGRDEIRQALAILQNIGE